MGFNLMKSPLAAVMFASLLFFADVFIPYSADYMAAYADFTMPLTGRLFFILFAFWICLAAAVAFGASEKSGAGVLAPLLAATLGSAYIAPIAEPVLFGPRPGLMGVTDALLSAGVKGACTILIFVLALLIYKTAAANNPADPKAAKLAVEYKLKILPFIIKIIVLPVIFCVLFYIAWYFLFWSNSDVRAFYEGPAEKLGFVPSIVNSLMNDSWMLLLALLEGFLYSVFALPLLFLFKGKRVIFIVLSIMLYLSHPLWLLAPTPYVPDNVRVPMCVFNAALLLSFGVLSGILLHTSFAKVEKPLPQRPMALAQPQSAAAAKEKTVKDEPPVQAKQVADVLSKTMAGKIK